jgi:hypothetical protein
MGAEIASTLDPIYLGGAPGDFQHPQRDDKGGDRPADRDRAVDQPAQQSRAQAQSDAGPQRPFPVVHGNAQHGGAKSQHRADRQVDSADDQHKGHPHGDDRQVRTLIGYRGQGLHREKPIAQGAEQYDQQQQDRDQSQIIGDRRRAQQTEALAGRFGRQR